MPYTTPYLALTLPDRASTGWADTVNDDFSILDNETKQIRQVLGHTLVVAKAYTDAQIASASLGGGGLPGIIDGGTFLDTPDTFVDGGTF